MRILLAILLASSTPAIAETCTMFGDTTFAELDAKQQARFVGGAGWATVTGITWKTVKATIQIERAPHLARTIIEDCPGVTVLRVTTLDARQLTSRVEVAVPSLRVALRLARLPAIRTLVLYDDGDKKRRNTRPHRLPD